MISKIQRMGFLYSVGVIINRVVPVWLFRFRRFVMLEMDPQKLDEYQVTDDANVAGGVFPVDVSWAQSEDISAIESLTYVDAEIIGPDVKIAQAKSNGQLAGALWSVENYFLESELGVAIELSPDQLWLFAALVDKHFRGRRIYPRLLKHMCCDDSLAKKGSVEFLLSVNPHNKQSWKVHKKFAKRKLGEVFSMRVFGIAMCICFGENIVASSTFTSDCKNRPILIRTRSL